MVIDHGRAIAAGTLPELVEQAGLSGRLVRVRLDRPAAAAPTGFRADSDPATFTASIQDVASELPGLLARLHAAGHAVRDLEVRTASLQSVFLELTGKELRE